MTELEPIEKHEGHKIIDVPRYMSSTVQRFCATCRLEIAPRKEKP